MRVLEYSRDLPIIMAVFRKSYIIAYAKEDGMDVSLFMDVLLPNLHRFQDIYFYLNQSSSLPFILYFIKQNQPPTPDTGQTCAALRHR